MPRNISRVRDEIGSSKKVPPRVGDETLQRVVNELYKELNEINLAVNKTPIGSESSPSDGDIGDIRLFTKTAQDGSLGYFVQGKFGDSWASGRLGLDLVDPNLPPNESTPVNSYVDDGGEYITKLGVTFENLSDNGDIGSASNQVAAGNHIHPTYENHINDSTIHFTLGDITGGVSNATTVGVATTAARSDHVHELDTSVTYDFTAKQTIAVNSGNALEVTGDVQITGDLTVDYAATGDGNGNADIDGNVVLNEADVGQDYSDTYTTRINGKLTAYNETVIQHNDNQLSLRHGADATKKFDINVNSNALTTFSVSNNEGILIDASVLRPDTNFATDLGLYNKKWHNLYAGELVVDNLVAQNVMATIGGRILVAPTTKLMQDLPAATGSAPYSSDIYVEHNIFQIGSVIFLQTAPNGVAQMEAMLVSSNALLQTDGSYKHTVVRDMDNNYAGPGNNWIEGDAVVDIGGEVGEGFIDLTSTEGIYSSVGPYIAMHVRKQAATNYGSGADAWQVPEVLRIGNLKGTWYTNNNKHGFMLGESLSGVTESTFKGMLGTEEGLSLYNSATRIYDGANLIAYLGEDNRTGVTGAQFALGDNLTFTNDTTSGAKLRFEKNASTNNYELIIDEGSINVTVDANDITGAMPWLDDSPSGAGFYVTGEYAGFYNSSNQWDVILGTNGSGDPWFQLGNTSSGSSLHYDGTDLNLRNLDIRLFNADNDVFIGEGITNADTNGSHNDIIIGSWFSQSNSAFTGSGILVKHGPGDYSKIGETGFNRRGYDYPVHIYQGLHWGLLWQNGQNGSEVNAANTLDNINGYSEYGTFPHEIRNITVGYWLTNSSYANYPTTVPEGRKLLIQINKVAGCEFGFYGSNLYCRPLMPTAYDFNFTQNTGSGGTFGHNHSYSASSNYLEDAMILHTDTWNLGQSDFYHTGSSGSSESYALRRAIANGLNDNKVFMYEIPENTPNLNSLKLLSCGSNAVLGIQQRNVCSVILTEVSM